ncbi:MAG: D-alanyl-D-alanine carboxypeptidase/D-alanyl-D-alanine-endopeptidase [Legionellales bacterium]|jgi:D-alanyl-D-alanine carboxypeptidase/D-alanyl-D-alanine-endopeptidase (penicillin-binding protein 4)
MKRVFLASLLVLISKLGLAAPIDNLVEKYIPNAHLGLYIQDADSKKILYTKNSEQGFSPASVTKAFTAAASLFKIDPEFSYQTVLGSNQNDLIVSFSGDPTLTTQDLENLLQAIKTVKGNIIIDNTYFPKPDEARGIVAEDLNWYFGTPAKSVIIDENQVPIKITASDDLKLVSEQEANTLCQLNVDLNPKTNAIKLYGCWPEVKKDAVLKVALANPELRVKQIILEYLAKQNIAFNGQIKIENAKIVDVIATHQSPPLKEMYPVIMKESNNIYADSLNKTLGKKTYDRGTLQAGSYAVQQILEKKLTINLDNIRLYDGAGGSIYNQVTPRSVALFLQAMYQSSYKNTFLNMQIVDDKHTFHWRLPENVQTNIYLKTGSMTGVSNMVGYIKTKSGKTLVLVCLLNGLPLDKTNAWLFEKELIAYLASQ